MGLGPCPDFRSGARTGDVDADVGRAVCLDRHGHHTRVEPSLRDEQALLGPQSRVVVRAQEGRVVQGVDGEDVRATDDERSGLVEQELHAGRPGSERTRAARTRGGDGLPVVDELRADTALGEPATHPLVGHVELDEALTTGQVGPDRTEHPEREDRLQDRVLVQEVAVPVVLDLLLDGRQDRGGSALLAGGERDSGRTGDQRVDLLRVDAVGVGDEGLADGVRDDLRVADPLQQASLDAETLDVHADVSEGRAGHPEAGLRPAASAVVVPGSVLRLGVVPADGPEDSGEVDGQREPDTTATDGHLGGVEHPLSGLAHVVEVVERLGRGTPATGGEEGSALQPRLVGSLLEHLTDTLRGVCVGDDEPVVDRLVDDDGAEPVAEDLAGVGRVLERTVVVALQAVLHREAHALVVESLAVGEPATDVGSRTGVVGDGASRGLGLLTLGGAATEQVRGDPDLTPTGGDESLLALLLDDSLRLLRLLGGDLDGLLLDRDDLSEESSDPLLLSRGSLDTLVALGTQGADTLSESRQSLDDLGGALLVSETAGSLLSLSDERLDLFHGETRQVLWDDELGLLVELGETHETRLPRDERRTADVHGVSSWELTRPIRQRCVVVRVAPRLRMCIRRA